MTGGSLGLRSGSYGSLQQQFQNGVFLIQTTVTPPRNPTKMLKEKEKLLHWFFKFTDRKKVGMLFLCVVSAAIFVWVFYVGKGEDTREGARIATITFNDSLTRSLPGSSPAYIDINSNEFNNTFTVKDVRRESTVQPPSPVFLGALQTKADVLGLEDVMVSCLERIFKKRYGASMIPHYMGGRYGIYGANSAEWILSMEACNAHGIHCVPFYDTLGANVVEFIICHAEVSIAFIEEKKILEYFNYMGMLVVEGTYDKMAPLLSLNIHPVDTLLMMAASEDDKPKLEEFLRTGASYDVKDTDGRTALDRATNV